MEKLVVCPILVLPFEALSPQLIGGSLGGQVGVRGVDPNLVPETASELEFGLDLGLLENQGNTGSYLLQ